MNSDKPLSAVRSVLLIDDNRDALDALEALLRAMGVSDVTKTTSAEEALDLLQHTRFTIILSDYRMDGMDGVAFCDTLRAQGDATPLVLLSGAPDKAGVLKAIHHAKVDFFGKPFKIADLTQAMERLLAA